MLCPTCSVDLVITDRQGVEIDYCPKCRGVWLDRGELDKIIERANAYYDQAGQAPAAPQPQAPQQPYAQPPQPTYAPPPHQGAYTHSYGYGSRHGYKKKKGILGDIFDF